MPSPNDFCPAPARGTQVERQSLLPQSNRRYSLPGGGYGSTVNSASSGTGQGDPLPPYSPGPGPTVAADSQKNLAFTKYNLPALPRGGWFVFVFILGGLIAWVAQDMWAMSILNPSAIERRRLGWDRDYARHLTQVSVMQNITVKWAQEIQEHAAARNAMRKERSEWEKERAEWLADRRERQRLQEEQMKLDLEKQRRELEKEEDEERRKKAGLKWPYPQPDAQCLQFGVRRYTAKLENVPEGYNRMKACHETQAWINGRWVNPTQCSDWGLWGGVTGTWIVDWDEAGCRTFFQDFKDKGCSAQGSGKRRIESHLENLRYGDDGMKMCSSTSADFHGLHFEAPDSCVYWGKYGYWGLWFIQDGSCA